MPRRLREEEAQNLTASKKTKLTDSSSSSTMMSSCVVVGHCFSNEISSSYSSNSRSPAAAEKPKKRSESVQSGEMDSTVKTDDEVESRRKPKAPKLVPHAEVEKFFAAEESEMLKHFAEKYNFDFVSEKPLEGRFEWEKVEP